jgi:DNA-binding MarR family transcriptional regulator
MRKRKAVDMDENLIPPPADGETIAALLYRAFTLMARASHHHGHTEHAQMRVLAMLRDRHSMNQRELLEMFNVRSASLSEIVGKLEHRGFIERERDEQDRRNFVVTITGQGSAAVAANEDVRRKSVDALFTSLSEEERQQLAELLGKIVRGLEEETSGHAFPHGHERHGHEHHGHERHGHEHHDHERRDRERHGHEHHDHDHRNPEHLGHEFQGHEAGIPVDSQQF